jgi:hypothetical protein
MTVRTPPRFAVLIAGTTLVSTFAYATDQPQPTMKDCFDAAVSSRRYRSSARRRARSLSLVQALFIDG